MNTRSTASTSLTRLSPQLRIAVAALIAFAVLVGLFGVYIPLVFFGLGVAGSLLAVAWAAPRRTLIALLVATVVLFVLTLISFGSPFFFIPLVSSASALRSKRALNNNLKNVDGALT